RGAAAASRLVRSGTEISRRRESAERGGEAARGGLVRRGGGCGHAVPSECARGGPALSGRAERRPNRRRHGRRCAHARSHGGAVGQAAPVLSGQRASSALAAGGSRKKSAGGPERVARATGS